MLGTIGAAISLGVVAVFGGVALVGAALAIGAIALELNRYATA